MEEEKNSRIKSAKLYVVVGLAITIVGGCLFGLLFATYTKSLIDQLTFGVKAVFFMIGAPFLIAALLCAGTKMDEGKVVYYGAGLYYLTIFVHAIVGDYVINSDVSWIISIVVSCLTCALFYLKGNPPN